jgi:hypothetical protein
VNKGNIVNFERGDTGIVLALTRDGKRALVYRYGPDFSNWVPLDWLTVEVAGDETCYKCGGSGLYYYGGMVLNGVYQGKTGPCFGCEGDGIQTDADRLRCHHYWHRQSEEGKATESPLERSPEPEVVKPNPYVPTEKAAKKTASKSAADRRRNRRAASPQAPIVNGDDGSKLIDCKGCGTLHRDDTLCPW